MTRQCITREYSKPSTKNIIRLLILGIERFLWTHNAFNPSNSISQLECHHLEFLDIGGCHPSSPSSSSSSAIASSNPFSIRLARRFKFFHCTDNVSICACCTNRFEILGSILGSLGSLCMVVFMMMFTILRALRGSQLAGSVSSRNPLTSRPRDTLLA